MARWIAFLNVYKYTFEQIKYQDNTVVDVLSRDSIINASDVSKHQNEFDKNSEITNNTHVNSNSEGGNFKDLIPLPYTGKCFAGK